MLLEGVLFTINKELRNLVRSTFGIYFGIASRMLHNKQRTAQPHSWHIGRHQETPKSIHASGASGPLPHVVTDARLGVRQELLDRLLHVTTEPSSWLQQKHTKNLCAGVLPQNAAHDLIPTPGSEERTDGESVCRIRFPDTDSKKGLLFQLFKIFFKKKN